MHVSRRGQGRLEEAAAQEPCPQGERWSTTVDKVNIIGDVEVFGPFCQRAEEYEVDIIITNSEWYLDWYLNDLLPTVRMP